MTTPKAKTKMEKVIGRTTRGVKGSGGEEGGGEEGGGEEGGGEEGGEEGGGEEGDEEEGDGGKKGIDFKTSEEAREGGEGGGDPKVGNSPLVPLTVNSAYINSPTSPPDTMSDSTLHSP